jgi:plastocyanin
MRLAVLAVGALVVAGATIAFVADDPLSGSPLSSDEVEPTGDVVEVRAWVQNHNQDVFPLYKGTFWAFCMEPMEGSEDAVVYQETGQPCSVPGPTLRVDQGDRVRVTFENPHQFPHTIHWHGQTVPNGADGVPGVNQDTVETNESFTYEFLAEREGSLMYHCHVDTQHHVQMGLYGAFIVEPQDPVDAVDEVDVERTLIMSQGNLTHNFAGAGAHDHSHGAGGGHGGGGGHQDHNSGSPGQQNSPFDRAFDLHMINGRSFPLTLEDESTHVDVQEGDLVRLRLYNAGFRTESMHLHGHDMLVTHKDGLALSESARYEADTLRLAPGERYDVLVRADNPGRWVMHTHVSDHVANNGQYPGGMLTHLIYDGFENMTLESEAPGGLPPVEGFSVGPHGGPLHETTMTGNLTGSSYEESKFLPVYSERASHANLTLSLDETSPADEVTATVVSPSGEELGSVTATGMETTADVQVDDLPERGEYDVRFEGQGADASFDLDVSVVYPIYEVP